MAADISLLDFLAPGIAAASEEDKQRALEIAAAYRPSCLPEAAQDTAQIYYAAWILAGRLAAADGVTIVPTGIISEKEGDRSVTYGNNGIRDSFGYYDEWKRLSDICGYGAITVGMPPVIYGYDKGY